MAKASATSIFSFSLKKRRSHTNTQKSVGQMVSVGTNNNCSDIERQSGPKKNIEIHFDVCQCVLCLNARFGGTYEKYIRKCNTYITNINRMPAHGHSPEKKQQTQTKKYI